MIGRVRVGGTGRAGRRPGRVAGAALCAWLIAAVALLAAPAGARAHEPRTLGPYEFVVGWIVG